MHVTETTTRLLREDPGLCPLIQDLLPLYSEGEVSPDSRDLIAAHLMDCPHCAGFLAGAQSVRAQLQQHQLQRDASLQRDAPQRRVVLRWRELLVGGVAMLLCIPGGMMAAAIGSGLHMRAIDVVLAGLVIATVVVGLLLALGRLLGPLTGPRLTTLAGGVVLGGVGAALTFLSAGHPFSLGTLAGTLLGFVLALAGLVGVWSGMVRGGRWPFTELP
jgi:hypothetical protein